MTDSLDRLTEVVAQVRQIEALTPDRPWIDADPPDWSWPYACHRYEHIYEMTSIYCVMCGDPHPGADPRVERDPLAGATLMGRYRRRLTEAVR